MAVGRKWRGVRVVAMVLLGVLLAGCGVGKNSDDQDGQFSFVSPGGQTELFYDVAQRKPLPDLSGDSLMQPGTKIDIASYSGKVVVINMWGAWCGPCRGEAPELQQVFNQTQSSGVQFVGIDVRDNRSDAQDFVRDNQLTYPSIYDFPGRTMLQLKGYPRSGVPSTIVLDRQHRVAAVYIQAIVAADLLPEVRKVLGET
jgi:thiol-disulfide isomerase/thioredoxin